MLDRREAEVEKLQKLSGQSQDLATMLKKV